MHWLKPAAQCRAVERRNGRWTAIDPRDHDRRSIALEQLETALRLWLERHCYFSVTTLAGAAEEIFGRCLEAAGRTNALGELKVSVSEIHRHLFAEDLDQKAIAERANRARNIAKHLNAGDALIVDVDAQEEAREMLNRAIDNYWGLEAKLSPAMIRFQREQHAD